VCLALGASLLAGCVEEQQEPEAALGCFESHLEEAIALNLERRPAYSALTAGASEAVTDQLVQAEEFSTYFARRVDEAARPFIARGVNVTCDEFMSMSLAPPFREHFEFEPEPLSSYVTLDGAAMRDALQSAYIHGGFSALSARATNELDALRLPRAYHCMTRHVLEALRRIANFAPVQAARASELGLGSTTDISDELVVLHLLALEQGPRLDEVAAPVQAQGVPILCQDVPHVPPGP
jgi:hypothetical protein